MNLPEIETAAQLHPLKTAASFRQVNQGATIAEIVKAHDLPERFGLPSVVLIRNGDHWTVPADLWGKVRPKSGTRVEIGYPVHGPAAGLIASALLPKAAAYVAGTTFGLTVGTFAYNVVVAAVTIVGSLLVNALIPPPTQPEIEESDPIYAITGAQNAENRYGVYPKVLGRHRMFPPKTARGYTETFNNEDIYYRGRVTFGHGPLALEDIRIGTTPITEFEGVEVEFVNVDQTETLALMPGLSGITRAWRSGTETLQLMPFDISEDSYNVELLTDEPVIRVTRDAAESVAIDISFPRGLGYFNDDGDLNTLERRFFFRYRLNGASTWTDAGNILCVGRSSNLMRFTYEINLPAAGEYEIEVKRTSINEGLTKFLEDSYLTAIRTRRAGTLPSHDGIAEMAFRLKSSGELNGQVSTLNAIVNQMGRVWNGSAWVDDQLIRHPAWIYADALQGDHLRRPIEDARLDLDALKAWADEESHWTCDYVVDSSVRTGEVLDIICAAGRAKKTLTDMKYSVIRDGGAGPIRQVFTPRNSWGFKGSVAFPRAIHAFRCMVISEQLEWQRDEILVFADGYTAANATEYETLELPGVVVGAGENQGNAWRLGRYHLAQAILRPEQYEWQADWESVRVTRGDKVQLLHDVPSIGVGWGRIKSIVSSGSTLTSITLDEIIDVSAGDYRITVRGQDGTRHSFTSTVASDASVQTWTYGSGAIDATDLAVGDLVAVEELAQETFAALVTGVFPETEGTARITAVPASPAVLSADSGTIPPYEPAITTIESNPNLGPAAPAVKSLFSDQTSALIERGGNLQARAAVSLYSFASNVRIGSYLQTRWRNTANTSLWDVSAQQPIASAAAYTGALVSGNTYEVEIRSVDDMGRASAWVSAGTVVASVRDGLPDDVTGWYVAPNESFVQMQHDDPGIFDLSHVEVRYSSGSSASWNASTPLTKIPYPLTSGTVFARAGTYLAKWVDRGGQKSANAASFYVSPAQIKAANAVETQTIDPTFTGTLVDTEVISGELQLEADGVTGLYPASGTWTGTTAVDLGAVFPVRITPLIVATAFSLNDAMSNWTSLADLESLAPSNPDAWGLQVEVAASDSDTSGGTDWRPLTGGEFIGRYFNFRVTLTTDRSDTTPRVSELSFVLDMPDRIEGVDGVASGTGGLAITYSPAFNAVPAVVITPINAPTGSYYTLTGESRSGFTVEFFNSSGTSIDVTFNWISRGYGREST